MEGAKKVVFKQLNFSRYGLMLMFDSENEMKEVYKALKRVGEENLACPVNMYGEQQDGEQEDANTCYGLGLEVGRSVKSLRQMVQEKSVDERREDFLKLRRDRKPYSLKPLYVSILRGLFKALEMLQRTNITACLELENIFVFTKAQDEIDQGWVGGKEKKYHLSNSDDELVQHHIIFGKYKMRGNRAGEPPLEQEVEEWSKLAETIKELNKLLGLENTDFPVIQMESLLNVLQSKPIKIDLHNPDLPKTPKPYKSMERIKFILEHPIFYTWRERKDCMCHLSNTLKGCDWENLPVINDHLNSAFGEWKPLFEKDSRLKLLRDLNDEYALSLKEDVKGEFDEDRAELSVDVKGSTDCIKTIRNIYSHFDDTKNSFLLKRGGARAQDKNTMISITNMRNLEDIFSQAFPTALYTLASTPAITYLNEGNLEVKEQGNHIWPRLWR